MGAIYSVDTTIFGTKTYAQKKWTLMAADEQDGCGGEARGAPPVRRLLKSEGRPMAAAIAAVTGTRNPVAPLRALPRRSCQEICPGDSGTQVRPAWGRRCL